MKITCKVISMITLLAVSVLVPSSVFAGTIPNQPITAEWSAEEPHSEGRNSHLWIVSHGIDIMSRSSVVKSNELTLLNQWRSDLEQGVFDADHMNPYYDNGTYCSHFYDPDTGKTYISLSLAKNAKETGAKYFRLAGEAYQKNDQKQAFYYLGLSLHYLTDLTQPMHASNFTNVSTPFGYHSKFEDFVDTIKENYKVTDDKGYWNFSSTPEEWLHQTAVQSKKDAPGILNSEIYDWFIKAAVSQYYADKWRSEVTPTAGKRLMEAQRISAGYIHFWFETYVN